MYNLTLKIRITMFFGILFLFIPLGLGGLYLALDGIDVYLSFPDVFVFSSFIIYGFTFFLIIFPLVFISTYPIFLGRQVSCSVQKTISNFIVFCFFFSILFQMGFKFYFISEFEKRGYIACRGIPLGWMPGMATKYATNEALCLKKDL
ncbi:hypothetical protein SJI19_14610 [Acerihabitans sp. TG2]|uniref:hypothetical protein n=1 Tax=Acerihabitans sp. TG2 TaxID=3096008 RepID=UPI002B23C78D|nr:hypothetical protein [Acerihabitans sp. TG2]MEA9391758.1 hypothetical protein [Acerihabitans sp. TG2]